MEDTKFYIGIDPGLKGGIAVLNDGGSVVEVDNMPETPQDILGLLGEYSGRNAVCVLEDVGTAYRDSHPRLPQRSHATTGILKWHCSPYRYPQRR